MSMPIISYDSVTNKLAVQTKPVATLGTNVRADGYTRDIPGIADFDPAQVWGVLNCTVFSRLLGWYDQFEGLPPSDIMSKISSVYGFEADAVTPHGRVWIESTSTTAGLNSYLAVGMYGVNANYSQIVDYANPTGVPYSGIFGTLGSPTKWQWDGLMDHNTYAVPFSYLSGPNQPFSATYRLYIGDAAGNELLTDKNGAPVSSAATTTTWNWQGPAFVFTSQNGVPSGSVVESDVYTATGITTPGTSDITISGGEYSLSTNGVTWGAWTSATGTIANSNRVKVRQTSAPGHGVTTLATLAIPGVPGTGQFRVTTTTAPDPAWPVKIQDGFDQPSLSYAYSIAPDMAEPNNAVIMVKEGILAESSFSAGRNIAVTLRGGYNTDFSSIVGTSVIQGTSNVLTVTQGKVIVDKVYIRSTVPL